MLMIIQSWMENWMLLWCSRRCRSIKKKKRKNHKCIIDFMNEIIKLTLRSNFLVVLWMNNSVNINIPRFKYYILLIIKYIEFNLGQEIEDTKCRVWGRQLSLNTHTKTVKAHKSQLKVTHNFYCQKSIRQQQTVLISMSKTSCYWFLLFN